MARHFLSLKVALLRNRAMTLRQHPKRLRALAFSALIFGWLAYQYVPGLYENLKVTGELPDPDQLVAMQSFSLVFMWIAMPLSFAGRRDLNVRRFQLLPMRPGTMSIGMAVTWLLSPWVWLTAAVAGIIVASFSEAATRRPLMVAGAVVLVAMCAVAGQLVVTGADLLARQRRARDFLILLSIGVSAVPVLLFVELIQQFDNPTKESSVAEVVGWLPPAWPGRAIAAAAQGDTGAALVAVGASVVVIALCWWAWTGIIARSMLAEDASTRQRRSRADPFARFARRLPENRRGAVAALELRMLWREPARLPSTILMTVFLGGIFTLMGASLYGGSDAAMAVLGTAAVTITIPGRRMNEVGIHSSALWTNVVAEGRASDDLIGRDLTNALIDVPLVAAVAVVIAAVTDGWAYLIPGLVIALALVLAIYATMHVISVRMAQGQPRSKDSDAPTQQGQDPILSLVALAAYLVVAAPVFAVTALVPALSPNWLIVVLPVALAYGAGLWLGSLRWIGGWLDRHEADLLLQISA